MLQEKKTYSRVTSIMSYYADKKDCSYLIGHLSLRPALVSKLKTYLTKEELGYDVDKHVCYINLGSCFADNKLDIAKLIQLIRNCFYLEPEENLKISFWGVSDLLRHFNYKRGSKTSLELLSRVLGLAKSHTLAFSDYLKGKPFAKTKIELVDEPTFIFSDAVLYDGKGMGKLLKGWVYDEKSDTFYVHDGLFQDLLDYGFSRDQLKQVIHLCQKGDTVNQLPKYIYRAYMNEPDAYKEISETLIPKRKEENK